MSLSVKWRNIIGKTDLTKTKRITTKTESKVINMPDCKIKKYTLNPKKKKTKTKTRKKGSGGGTSESLQ